MAQVQFRSGEKGEMTRLAGGLVIAVDIGFAQDGNKSCGLPWKHGEKKTAGAGAFEYASVILRVSELLKSENTATLIIEAPLSAMFSASGNPVRRGDFEKRPKKELNDRYWYTNAGAVTCLASIIFLREMKNRLLADKDSTAKIAIHLYEGFISFKTKSSKKAVGKWADKADAKRLLNCFENPRTGEVIDVKPEDGQSSIVFTDIVTGIGNSSEIPVILKP
jgi:hypothetical protein